MVASLSQEVTKCVMPTLEAQSGYTALKNGQRADRLLNLPGLGDKLPSVLAGEILALVPKDVIPSFLE